MQKIIYKKLQILEEEKQEISDKQRLKQLQIEYFLQLDSILENETKINLQLMEIVFELIELIDLKDDLNIFLNKKGFN